MKKIDKINKFICIHAHFYQPPRENPYLEKIEFQESAMPYHDWNERITLECYGPNLAARIVSSENKIIDLVNNYQHISYNFGPTLLHWMEKNQKYIYDHIILSDQKNNKNSFYNSAVAQCYNHIIMPLASSLDKETQIIWGIKDFEYRFKRKPKGMWLSETAVDLETLTLMRKHQIEFIILSPFQAHKVRYHNAKNYQEVYSSIDTRRPYYIKLKDDKKIFVFFYNGSIAKDMAFQDLLGDSEKFYNRFIQEFSNNSKEMQIVNVALDGETFGHHKKFADMALASFIKKVEREKNISLISYEEFLNRFEVKDEITIIENSAWSCAHGVGRWKEDCGCSISQRADINQKWRKPLFQAMHFLKNELLKIYLKKMSFFTKDPIKIRNEYIEIILDSSFKNIEKFIKTQTSKTLTEEEKTQFLKLLLMQKYSMSMFTSCGWFFDDLLNIETQQIILYAANAIELAKDISNIDLEEPFKKILQKAKSFNNKNGEEIYNENIKPRIINLKKIAVFFSIYTLFESQENLKKYYCYSIEMKSHNLFYHNKKHLSLLEAQITSDTTLEKYHFYCAAIHFEDQNLIVGISENKINFDSIKDLFFSENIDHLKQLLYDNFEIYEYSFWDLLIDDRRKIIDRIFDFSLNKIYKFTKKHYEKHYTLINEMHKRNITLSKSFINSLHILLNQTLLEEMQNFDLMKINKLTKTVQEMLKWGFDVEELAIYYLEKILEDLICSFQNEINDIHLLKQINHMLDLFEPFKLKIHLWKVQNIYFDIHRLNYNKMLLQKEKKDAIAIKWIKLFNDLQKKLHINL